MNLSGKVFDFSRLKNACNHGEDLNREYVLDFLF